MSEILNHKAYPTTYQKLGLPSWGIIVGLWSNWNDQYCTLWASMIMSSTPRIPINQPMEVSDRRSKALMKWTWNEQCSKTIKVRWCYFRGLYCPLYIGMIIIHELGIRFFTNQYNTAQIRCPKIHGFSSFISLLNSYWKWSFGGVGRWDLAWDQEPEKPAPSRRRKAGRARKVPRIDNPIKMDDLGVSLFQETSIWIGIQWRYWSSLILPTSGCYPQH